MCNSRRPSSANASTWSAACGWIPPHCSTSILCRRRFQPHGKSTPATQLQLGYGRYHQFYFPATTLPILTTTCSQSLESLQAANHYIAALEQRVGESTRVKLLLFDRSDDSSRPVGHWRLSAPFRQVLASDTTGAIIRGVRRSFCRAGPRIASPAGSATRSLTLVRGYYSKQDLRPVPFWSPYYPTLADQRHTLNLFANYRLTPTLNLGGKFLFGSGYPVPSGEYNSIRLGDYQRLDVRAEKDWAFRRWKLAAYAELLNTTNHYNPRYFYTQQLRIGSDWPGIADYSDSGGGV